MSAILDALVKLEQSIGNLEGAAAYIETNLAGQQRDMFSSPAPPPANGNGAENIDMNLVAEKLDSAIENVEKVLQEGRG